MAKNIILPEGIIGDLLMKLLPFNGDFSDQPRIVEGCFAMAVEPTATHFDMILDHLLEDIGLVKTVEFGHAISTPDKVEFMSDAFPSLERNRYRIEDISQPYHIVLEFFGCSDQLEDRQVHIALYYDRPFKDPSVKSEDTEDTVSYHCSIVYSADKNIFVTGLENEEFALDRADGQIVIFGAEKTYTYYQCGDIERVEPQEWLRANTSVR